MPLSEDAHAAVDRYRQDVEHGVKRIGDLTSDVAALARQIAPGGPLGTTSDPDLTRARERLALARDRLATSARTLAASPEPARAYAARAFPR